MQSISEIPVTISAFNMENVRIPIRNILDTRASMWLIARAITVPMTAVTQLRRSLPQAVLVYKAYMIVRL